MSPAAGRTPPKMKGPTPFVDASAWRVGVPTRPSGKTLFENSAPPFPPPPDALNLRLIVWVIGCDAVVSRRS